MTAGETITIRPAEPRDAAAIADLANMLAVTVGDRAPGDGAMTAEIVARDLVDAPGLTLLVAERQGRTVGYALLTAAYETAHAVRGVYLTDLAVAEEARRSGVARALLRAAARHAIETGGRYVWWVVAHDNAGAKAFYDRFGGIKYPIEARAVFDAPFDAILAAD